MLVLATIGVIDTGRCLLIPQTPHSTLLFYYNGTRL